MRKPGYHYLGAYSQIWGWDKATLCAGIDAPEWFPTRPWTMDARRAAGIVHDYDQSCDDFGGHPLTEVCIVQDRWDATWDETLDFGDVDKEIRHAA